MDMDILMLMINLRFDSEDFSGADWILRQAQSWPWPDNELQRLAEADLQFYLFKLAEAVKENDPESGWQLWNEARTKYDDPKLELFGVKLALLEDDWQTAEELLTRQWPTELAGQVNNLAEQIAELKKLENKIVIRFAPGAKQIPVTARLNDTVDQNFLIDTGATTVTIPLHTAEELGLEIDKQAPRHKVSTAGGEIMAWEVELDEIELGGWAVSGIKALIIDIPGQADSGLLGLNFLNYFVVNLDSDEGILLLEPK
jgi:clan AA aspartic protease (TIGR02281 family)